MPDIKISELPEVGSLVSNDITPFVASGITSKIRLSNLANTMPNVPSATSASYSSTSSYSNFANTSSVSSRILGGVQNYIPIWYTSTTLDSSQIYQLSNNIIIGGTTNPDNYKLYVIGSGKFTSGLNITGSVKINNLSETIQTNIVGYNNTTGQLYYQNTASFTASYSVSSSNAQTASFVTASNVYGPFGSNSILSASYSVSSSYAQTASYVLNAVSASYASTSSNILGGTNGYIPLWSGSSKLTISNIYQSASSIGIGITSPQNGFLLDVNGQTVIRSLLYIQTGITSFGGGGGFTINDNGISKINGGPLLINSTTQYNPGVIPDSTLLVGGKILPTEGIQIVGNDSPVPVISASRSDNTQYGTLIYNGWGDFAFNKSLLIGYTPRSSVYGEGYLYVLNSIGINKTGSNASLDVNGNVIITGSLSITNLSNISQPNFVAYNTNTGQLTYASTSSFTASTASFVTASNVWGPFGRNSILSASYSVSSSNAQTASYALNAVSSSYATTASYSVSSSNAQTASYVLNAVSSSYTTTASYVLNAVSASYATTASYSVSSSNATTASYVLNAVSASYAFTSSFSNNFNATNLSLGTNPINVTTGYGNYISTVTYRIAEEASPFWIKIISIDSYPQRIKLFIQGGSDNTLAYDEFEIATSGYGMPHNILRKPTTIYNESKIVGILTSNPSDATQEVWINVLGTADPNSYLPFIFIYSNVNLLSLADMQASRTTTKPTKANGGTELVINNINNNNKRTKYTIQTSAGAEFNNEVFVSGSVIANSFTGSLFGTASYANNAVTASYALTASIATTSSYATTASYSVSSSYATTASYSVSSSYATTASYVLNAVSASYATTASYSVSSSYATTASYVLNAVSSSYATTASYVLNAVSSSYASTSSNVLGGTNNFVTKWTNNTSLGSSLIYDNGTNIGIGTTSPDSLLSLEKANINNVSLFKIKGHSGPTPATVFDTIYEKNAAITTISYYGGNESKIVLNGGTDNDGGNILLCSGSGVVTARLHGTSNSWISSGSGNFGVGTNTPLYKLDISGSLRANSSIIFPGVSNASKSNIIGYDSTNGQLYYQTTSSLLPDTSSYSITSSLALKNIVTASADSSYIYFTKGDGTTFNISFPTVGTATNADTASFVTSSNVWGPFGRNSIVSASYVNTAQTASYVLNSVSSSYASSSLSSSYALTASYILGSGGTTPTLQQVTNQGSSTTVLTNFNSGLIISSSLKVTGSLNISASVSMYSSSLINTTNEVNILSYNTSSGKLGYQSIASLGVAYGTYIPEPNSLTNISTLVVKQANYMGIFGGAYTVSGIFYITPINQNTVTSFLMTTPTNDVMGDFVAEEQAAGTAYFHSASVQSGLRIYADENKCVKVSYYNTTAQTLLTCSFIYTYYYYSP